ncbi:MAG: glycosyltransferase [Aulosira sp. ZfuVER01]|nr:glycosyltransferase [Aulosira sp. ZfuVER01]MDZ7997285.1 glycosyltransferase [Aulosira sp. DedVER01a]MDZ8055546.1 glycosyltransferase [Aulosira sp. ZfuCHP01]
MKCHEGTFLNFSAQHPEVVFIRDSLLSFNTYFNSFFEKFYAKYTEISSLYYLLKLEGDFQISLYREHHEQDNRELIYTESFEKCQLCNPVKLSLPDSWRSEHSGRAYLEITCLSEQGLFSEGLIITDQPKIREVKLGIITCTFKKEAYLKNTVNTILKDRLLQDKQFKVFIVDNGRTLTENDFGNPKVQLISNRNVGGSGGFTRGLIQAVQEGIYTHFLFMDDDIELESESIYKLFPLYEYANQDLAVSGSMLDLYNKHRLFEAGAVYGKAINNQGNSVYNPFGSLSLKPGLNLENISVLNLLLSEDSPDYGGFWFFSFSKETIQKTGLPMPFFIKIDDMEFGLRIKECLGNSIVAFPGVAVWHEPFYAKNPIWDNYYKFRNHLITNSIYRFSGYIKTVKFLTQQLIYNLLAYDYNSAEMLITGFEDYFKGPQFLINNDPEKLHTRVLGLSKSYNTQSVRATSTDESLERCNSSNKNIISPLIKKIIALVTINGHLLPDFLISNEEGYYRISSEYTDYWDKEFAKRRFVIAREGNSNVYVHEMNRKICINLLIRWVQIIMKNASRWSSVSSEWRNAFKYLTSSEFWQNYLKLNEHLKA